MNDVKILNILIDTAKIQVENLKEENKRLIKENNRLLTIIENITKKNETDQVQDEQGRD